MIMAAVVNGVTALAFAGSLLRRTNDANGRSADVAGSDRNREVRAVGRTYGQEHVELGGALPVAVSPPVARL